MNHLTFFLALILNFTSYSISPLQYIPIHEKDSLNLDNSIRYGCINNGLTYYIKNVKQPSSKIHLKLYVNVGNFDEEDNQWQFAHTLEHLAFRESVNFPKEGGIQDPILLNKLGMTNRDINGITLNHVTTYKFNAPVKNSAAIDKGLYWFKDIISGKLKLLDHAIENERGIVRQELIGSTQNAETYFADVSLKAKLFPGIQEVHDLNLLKTFKPIDLKRFYHDWYRPDLTAISVVGNITNVDDLEIQIKKLFSDIKRKHDTKKLIDHRDVYLHQPPQFGVVEHKENSIENDYASFETRLYFRDAITEDPHHTWNEVQQGILWKLFEQIIQSRFIEATHIYNSFFNVNSHYMDKANFPAFKVSIISENNKEKEALKEVIKILGQVQRDGVLNEEWIKVKNRQLENFKQIKHDIPYWERGIREHFVYGTDFQTDMDASLSKWLSDLSLDEFNYFIKESHEEEPEDIGIIAPKGHSILSSISFDNGRKVNIQNSLFYKEQQVRSWIKDALDHIPSESYRLPEIPENLMKKVNIEKLELKGYKKKGIDNYGAEEYQLDNGVKVILKSFKPSVGVARKGDIIMCGFSSKGALCYPKEDYFSAINSSDIVKNSGVGKVNKFQLKDFLSSTHSSPRFRGISPYISDLETGIRGDANLDDLETMLQLVYLYFTQPRMNEKAYIDWKSNELEQMAKKSAQKAEFDFRYEVKNIIGHSTGFDELPGLGKRHNKGTYYYEGVDKTEMNRAYEIYRELFGNARDFTFIFSGDFPKDLVLTLIRKYLGNLPNLSVTSCENVSILPSKLPEGPIYKEIETASTKLNRGFYNLKFLKQANAYSDWKKQVKVVFLGFLTSVKLNSLRDKGLPLYYFGAAGKFRKDFLQYEVDLFLRTDPEYFPILREECHKIVWEIKNGEIEENEFEEAYKRLNRFYNAENRLNQNFVKSYLLYEHYKYGVPLIEPSVLQPFIESLTLKDVKSIAQELFKKENQFEFSTK